jgi:hypothetical protein
MRKLKLNVDSLSVESFQTVHPKPARGGTVHGAAATHDPWTEPIADTGVVCGNTWPADPTTGCVDYTNDAPSTCCYIMTNDCP